MSTSLTDGYILKPFGSIWSHFRFCARDISCWPSFCYFVFVYMQELVVLLLIN